MNEYRLVVVTTPDEEEGMRIARKLVEKELAACVNVVPKMRSVYRWKGEVVEDTEALLLIKTRTKLLAKVERRVKKMHSYEVPEFLIFKIDGGSDDYLKWLGTAI